MGRFLLGKPRARRGSQERTGIHGLLGEIALGPPGNSFWTLKGKGCPKPVEIVTPFSVTPARAQPLRRRDHVVSRKSVRLPSRKVVVTPRSCLRMNVKRFFEERLEK